MGRALCPFGDQAVVGMGGMAPYHGGADFTGIHIHSADVVKGVDVSFLKKSKAE